MDLGGLDALNMAPCAKCGFPNFVPLFVGGFLLVEPVGAGGISSVYKAVSESEADPVRAVKLLRPECAGDPDAIEAFTLEAAIHSQIPEHPYIVGYVDSGFDADEHYYVLDFVEGTRLDQMVGDSGALPEQNALAIAAQLTSALEHIHQCGFLYRDINAGNVILRDSGEITLIDFGLTLPNEFAYRASKSRYIWGSGALLPPERIARTGEDERSVIYSVGMLLFWMLTGRAFFSAEDLAGQARRHVSTARLAVTAEVLPGCPEPTVALVGSMIRHDPAERIQTFAELKGIVLSLLG